MNELALFAGAGGSILAGKLLGWRTVCAVEIDSYARSVLLARQRDGILDPFPVWDDVATFDGKQWRGSVDVITAGFPCQDISICGKGEGITGARSGLWKEAKRIIGEVRSKYVFLENSTMLASRGLGVVLGDLAELGFDAEWGVFSAAQVGAPHLRERLWIVAHDVQAGLTNHRWLTATKKKRKIWEALSLDHCVVDTEGEAQRWTAEPGVDRVVYGMDNAMDRLAALGNGWVPQVAVRAWKELTARF